MRSQGQEEVIQQELLVESLEKMIQEVCAFYHVKAEPRFVSLVDARDGSSGLSDDPLYLHHVATSPSEWRIGDPLQNLKYSAIDIDQPLHEWQAVKIGSTGLGYMAMKASYFDASSQLVECTDSISEVELEVLRRSIEFAKAAARKIIAISAVDGRQQLGADVTSRDDMNQRFTNISSVVDSSGEMTYRQQQLSGLDKEYDLVLERAISTRNFDEYATWIRNTLQTAPEVAYRLAATCHNYAERVVEENDMVMSDFPGFYDDAYRLVNPGDAGLDEVMASSSAPLLDVRQR